MVNAKFRCGKVSRQDSRMHAVQLGGVFRVLCHSQKLNQLRCFSHICGRLSIGILNNEKLVNRSYLIHTTASTRTFWESEKKSGYASKEIFSRKKLILDGLKELRTDMEMLQQEIKEKLETDPILVFRPGEVDTAFKFSDQKDMENWVVTADSDHNEGYSKASFELSQSGHGLFSGNLQSHLPKGGRIKKAGYCNIRSQRARVNYFKQEKIWKVHFFNLILFFRNPSSEKLILIGPNTIR